MATTLDFSTRAHDLAKHIAKLHQGVGMVGDVSGRIAPDLAAALGPVPPDRDLGAHLRLKMSGATVSLNRQRRVAFLFASGIHGRQAFLEERLRAAGDVLERDVRTVRRYLDKANVDVASYLLDQAGRAQPPGAPQHWTVNELTAELDLCGPVPVYTATKTIFVTAPTLDHVVDSLNLLEVDSSGAMTGLDASVLTGGALEQTTRVGRSAWSLTTRLPRVLAAGSTHRYTLRVRIPSIDMVRPMHVTLPLRPCAAAGISARFSPGRLPRRVIRLDGALPAVLAEPMSAGLGQSVPAAELVSCTFHGLVTGMVYGLWWEP